MEQIKNQFFCLSFETLDSSAVPRNAVFFYTQTAIDQLSAFTDTSTLLSTENKRKNTQDTTESSLLLAVPFPPTHTQNYYQNERWWFGESIMEIVLVPSPVCTDAVIKSPIPK